MRRAHSKATGQARVETRLPGDLAYRDYRACGPEVTAVSVAFVSMVVALVAALGSGRDGLAGAMEPLLFVGLLPAAEWAGRWSATVRRVALVGGRLVARYPLRRRTYALADATVGRAGRDGFVVTSPTIVIAVAWSVRGAWAVYQHLLGREPVLPGPRSVPLGTRIDYGAAQRYDYLLAAAAAIALGALVLGGIGAGWVDLSALFITMVLLVLAPALGVRWLRRPRRRRFEVTDEGLLVGGQLLRWADVNHLDRCDDWRGRGWLVWSETASNLWVPDTPAGRVVAEALEALLAARRRPAAPAR